MGNGPRLSATTNEPFVEHVATHMPVTNGDHNGVARSTPPLCIFHEARLSNEAVKRLTPTKDTLRELYLKSGNQCAYPGCSHVMIDGAGIMLGQICHIEAAEEGGQRFNRDQTNEQRRQISNLMLLCYDHHILTNDVDAFPVSRMREIKLNHESIFSDVGTLLFSAFNQTDSVASRLAGLITGGDSVPIVRLVGNQLSLSHFRGDAPIYDVRVQVAEYWWPNPDQQLPATFWIEHGVIDATKPPGSTMYLPSSGGYGRFDFSTLVTSRGEVLSNEFEKSKVLFPETGKWLLDITITARNGSFRQFIAGRKIKYRHQYYWQQACLLEHKNGEKIHEDGTTADAYWAPVPTLIDPHGRPQEHPGKKYMVWEAGVTIGE